MARWSSRHAQAKNEQCDVLGYKGLLRLGYFARVGLLAASACAAACTSASSEQAPRAVFGGQGAQIVPAEIPLPPATAPVASGPCAKPAPASDTTLLDDFEDNDNKPFRAFQREGWWYVAGDETPGGETFPKVGTFHASPLPEGEATESNQFAEHWTASGFQDWGVVWGTTLKWVNDGISCPFNAAAFSGLRFRAKGQATLMVKIGIPETIPGDGGGSCEKKCYDSHGKLVRVTPEWQVHEVPFDRLQQAGWGAEARFDPQHLLNITFAVSPDALPVDFWVDDIEFIKAEATPAPKAAISPQLGSGSHLLSSSVP